MAGYIQWLAGQMTDIRGDLPSKLISLRSHVDGNGQHARTPDATANMALGWHYFLRFAHTLSVLSHSEAESMFDRVWRALIGTAAEQSSHLVGEDPATRFIELLRSALSRGEAYVSRPDGSVPPRPTAWGWRLFTVGTGAYERDEWRPQGHAVGWVDDNDLYLDPPSAYAAIQKLGSFAGGGIALTPITVHKRLNQAKLLKTTGGGTRKTLTIRRTMGDKRVEVLHLSATTVMPKETDQSDQSDQNHRTDSTQASDVTTDNVSDEAPGTVRDGALGELGQNGQLTMTPSDRVTCLGCGARIFPRHGQPVCDACHKRRKSAA